MSFVFDQKKGAKFLLSAFTNKCIAALERIGDEASRIRKGDEALAAYAAALSLCPSSHAFLHKWVGTMLLHRSTNEILDAAREVGLCGMPIINADIYFISWSFRILPFTMQYATSLKGMVELWKQSDAFDKWGASPHKLRISATSDCNGRSVSGDGGISPGLV